MWSTTLNETTRLTIELRDIVDNGDNSVDIWDFEYPSYYEGVEKSEFERKVIDHYYFRQIGSETVGRFLHQFRTRIREIMPYYIQMYRTQEIMNGLEDPFSNVDVTETFEQTTTGTTSETQTGSNTASFSSEGSENGSITGNGTNTKEGSEDKTSTENKQHLFSNTPQGSISNLEKYLTEANKDSNTLTEGVEVSETVTTTDKTDTTKGTTESGENESTTELSTEGNRNETVRHTYTKKGNQGVNTYAHDMIEFRTAIINIDMMIIKELNDLFLGVY